MIYFCLLLHICTCALLLVLIKRRALKTPMCMAPIIALVPFFGASAALMIHFTPRVARVTSLNAITTLTDSYESIFKEGSAPDAVPLTDALLLDSAATRRRLMLEALSENPEGYVQLFRTARQSEDAEISHYAATALSELDKACFEKLALAEREYKKECENALTLKNYITCVKRCISLSAADADTKSALSETLITLLQKQITLCGGTPKRLEELFDLQLKTPNLNNLKAAKATLDELKKICGDGRYIICAMRLCFAKKDGAALKACLENAAESGIYLTPSQQKTLEYWKC